ncbi:NAD+ kinase [Zhouia amylolytica]|uniref:NAD kinase n=1 Tax=Zhouia amylolytica TaxID=376730 RepID=A0A1I6REW2_9FLAO|nr:NAD kinase [Zhouia amylolytica]MCQ0110646.1 NAD kinase [Zhouia amylolytica]SFS63242.1 NAD+ kinase [Zhouia amylolytica]
MKVGIYGQYYQDGLEVYLIELLTELEKNKVKIFFEQNYLSDIKNNVSLKNQYETFSEFEDLDDSFNLFFSVGGDGTMLRSILYVRDLNIPIIGINVGRLGFLATVQKDQIKKAVEALVDGRYDVEERSLLQIETHPYNKNIGTVNFAMNEMAVSRKNTTSMITVSTWLDDEYLTSYWADGLIVSTPTGSTGYSLSCGGPVITPDTNAFVITPIAPHNLNARPLVIPDKTVIKLTVFGRSMDYLLSLDSRIATLSNETEIYIKKAPFTIKMVEFREESFLKTLRKKLLWGEDKRN